MKKEALIIVCLWLIIICVFTIKEEFTFVTGREILLKTVPVDPRDLLRGDYVILNYEIAQIPKRRFSYNSTVYVALNTTKDNIAYVKYISYEKPKDDLYLKGKVGKCNTSVPFFKNGQCVNFGIESYFVKEGTGRKLENDLQKGALVKAAVNKNGYAKVKGFVLAD